MPRHATSHLRPYNWSLTSVRTNSITDEMREFARQYLEYQMRIDAMKIPLEWITDSQPKHTPTLPVEDAMAYLEDSPF